MYALATPKQIAFIETLATERGVAATAVNSKQEASALISKLLSMPRAPKTTTKPATEPEDGMYLLGSTIYKVYKMVHGSGRQGLKILVVNEGAPHFDYVGLASKYLPSDARRMTLEEAKRWGSIYGYCVRCAATLTDEGSIAAGIGPICAGKI